MEFYIILFQASYNIRLVVWIFMMKITDLNMWLFKFMILYTYFFLFFNFWFYAFLFYAFICLIFMILCSTPHAYFPIYHFADGKGGEIWYWCGIMFVVLCFCGLCSVFMLFFLFCLVIWVRLITGNNWYQSIMLLCAWYISCGIGYVTLYT